LGFSAASAKNEGEELYPLIHRVDQHFL